MENSSVDTNGEEMTSCTPQFGGSGHRGTDTIYLLQSACFSRDPQKKWNKSPEEMNSTEKEKGGGKFPVPTLQKHGILSALIELRKCNILNIINFSFIGSASCMPPIHFVVHHVLICTKQIK